MTDKIVAVVEVVAVMMIVMRLVGILSLVVKLVAVEVAALSDFLDRRRAAVPAEQIGQRAADTVKLAQRL